MVAPALQVLKSHPALQVLESMRSIEQLGLITNSMVSFMRVRFFINTKVQCLQIHQLLLKRGLVELPVLRSMVAPALQALKSPIASPALEKMRSIIAPALQALKSLTALQALALLRSIIAPALQAL